MDERGRTNGVRAFSVHPGGIVDTSLGKYLSREELQKTGVLDHDGKPVIDPSRGLKTVEQGAATGLWCATSPKLDGMGAVYCQDNDIASLVGDGVQADRQVGSAPLGVMPYAVDREAAERLWALSEKLLNLKPFDSKA